MPALARAISYYVSGSPGASGRANPVGVVILSAEIPSSAHWTIRLTLGRSPLTRQLALGPPLPEPGPAPFAMALAAWGLVQYA